MLNECAGATDQCQGAARGGAQPAQVCLQIVLLTQLKLQAGVGLSQCAELVKELDHQKALVDEAGAKFTALSTEKEAAEAAHEEMKLVTGQEKEALEAKVGVGACS